MLRLISSFLAGAILANPVQAERLDMAFLPLDFPPSNVCNAEPEQVEDDETSEGGSGGQPELDDDERLQFLIRDIRDLSRDGPDIWFDHIVALLEKRAELDLSFTDYDIALATIELHLKAGKKDDRWVSELVNALRIRHAELSGNNQVRLARYFTSGLGVAPDPEFAKSIYVAQAYNGNSSALFELLRLLQRGESIKGWDLGIQETAEMAFGGLVGQFNRGLCARAERMAREYINGEFLKPNPDLAYAWRKFAADMGGADAAWRVVEHHLNATAPVKDDAVLLHYLKQAVEYGFNLGPEELAQLEDAGASIEAEIREILGHNQNRTGHDRRRSAVPFLTLKVNRFTDGITQDSEYFQYLKEIITMPSVPAPTLRAYAGEILLRRGRWISAGEAETHLRAAADQGDAAAMVQLAELLTIDAHDDARMGEAEQLLLDAATLAGHPPAMRALDAFYRCQVPDAPRNDQAKFWAESFRNSGAQPYGISASDAAKLSMSRNPREIAQLQSFAVQGHALSAANYLQVLQSNALSSDAQLSYWARRVSRSDQGLEAFVKGEYEIASTPSQRGNAVELMRRAFLDIGPAISLDLAVTLTNDIADNPTVADEIRRYLKSSAQRGEGAAIRLLQRLERKNREEVYEQFKDIISARGDFLALMFAAPFVPDDEFDAHMARAISIMNCRSKDIAEIADVYAEKGNEVETLRWLRIGLQVEGGHALSRLGLSDEQMASFGRESIQELPLDENSNLQLAYLRAADPDDEGFDPEMAAAYLEEMLADPDIEANRWAIRKYTSAPLPQQFALDDRMDVTGMMEEIARSGDHEIQFQYGMLLRRRAKVPAELSESTDWLMKAAENGHPTAMAELGFAIGLGLGVPADPRLGLIWIEKANSLGDPRADELAGIFSAMVSE